MLYMLFINIYFVHIDVVVFSDSLATTYSDEKVLKMRLKKVGVCDKTTCHNESYRMGGNESYQIMYFKVNFVLHFCDRQCDNFFFFFFFLKFFIVTILFIYSVLLLMLGVKGIIFE